MSAKAAPKKRRRWIVWVILAVVVVAIVALVAPMVMRPPGGATIETATVQRVTLDVNVSGSGNVVAGTESEVVPAVSGTVKGLAVKVGQSVRAGDTLFTIKNADLVQAAERDQASYDQARQQLANAKSQRIQASNNLYNLEHPTSSGPTPAKAATQRDLELAEQQLAAAKVGVTAAQQQVDSARYALQRSEADLDDRTVVAPISGLVTEVNVRNGGSTSGSGGTGASSTGASSGSGSSGSASSLSAASAASGASSSGGGSAAVVITDTKSLLARVAINEVDLRGVKVGQAALVTFDALPGVEATGKVSAIAPTGTSSNGVVNYDVDVTLAAIPAGLRTDMSCSADIKTAARSGVLVVPSSAVKTENGKRYVMVVDGAAGGRSGGPTGAPSGQAPGQGARMAGGPGRGSGGVKTYVTVGQVVDGKTEIVSGLKAGQTVVTSSTTTGSGGAPRQGGGMFPPVPR